MSKAAKNDHKKPDLSLLPKIFMEEVARAFQVGEVKYGRYNYCKGHNASQLVAAAQRHMTAWFEGEEHDPVDGQHHLGAAGACLAMMLRQQQLGTMIDDRFKHPLPKQAEIVTISEADDASTVLAPGSYRIIDGVYVRLDDENA